MARKYLTGLQLANLASDPISGVEGELYYNTTSDKIRIYINDAWTDLSASIEGQLFDIDSIEYPDYIALDTNPSLTSASVGTIAWDSGEEGLSVQVNENVNLTLGKEIYALAYNGEDDTLEPGEVVMVNGAQGQRPQVIRAYNTSDATSARTFGMVAESIPSGGEGIVITQGVIANINTDDYEAGDILYLSASPGLVTTVKPQAPNHYVWVGVVLKKNSSSGRIYIKPQNGYELDEIHDVRITSIAEGDIIVWNSASSLWLNEPIQNYINTASAAAYASASAYTDSEISSLTTTDIEEGSNLYFTEERSLTTASNALVHNNHNNIVSSYDEENNQIILSASVSSGAAIANTDLSEPSASENTGLLYFNPNDFTFSIAYGGTWLQLASVAQPISGGSAGTSEFSNVFDGGNSSSTYDSYLIGGDS